MSQATKQRSGMARAFLTEGERKALNPDSDMDSNTRSTHIARIKGKIPALREDGRVLREHRPEIYEQAHEAFCEEGIDERVQQLENRLETVMDRLEEEETEQREGEDG